MNNDLISRKWLTDAIRNRRTYLSYEDAKDVIDLIDNAPTVKAFTEEDMAGAYNEGYACGSRENTRPQGEWIKDNSGNRFCSECGSSALYHEIGLKFESRFCPNCGAYMKGSVDNAPTVAINKDFYKTDKSNPINRSDLFQ